MLLDHFQLMSMKMDYDKYLLTINLFLFRLKLIIGSYQKLMLASQICGRQHVSSSRYRFYFIKSFYTRLTLLNVHLEPWLDSQQRFNGTAWVDLAQTTSLQMVTPPLDLQFLPLELVSRSLLMQTPHRDECKNQNSHFGVSLSDSLSPSYQTAGWMKVLAQKLQQNENMSMLKWKRRWLHRLAYHTGWSMHQSVGYPATL